MDKRPEPISELPAGFSLRPATNSDAPAVIALVFSILADYGLKADPAATDADLSDIDAHYFRHGGCFDLLLETASNRIVGTVGLHPMQDGQVELRKMYLHPDCRGRGLGRYLLQHAIAEARRRGFQRIFLETATVLLEAVRLYENAGFKPCPSDSRSSRCDLTMMLELT